MGNDTDLGTVLVRHRQRRIGTSTSIFTDLRTSVSTGIGLSHRRGQRRRKPLGHAYSSGPISSPTPSHTLLKQNRTTGNTAQQLKNAPSDLQPAKPLDALCAVCVRCAHLVHAPVHGLCLDPGQRPVHILRRSYKSGANVRFDNLESSCIRYTVTPTQTDTIMPTHTSTGLPTATTVPTATPTVTSTLPSIAYICPSASGLPVGWTFDTSTDLNDFGSHVGSHLLTSADECSPLSLTLTAAKWGSAGGNVLCM